MADEQKLIQNIEVLRSKNTDIARQKEKGMARIPVRQLAINVRVGQCERVNDD